MLPPTATVATAVLVIERSGPCTVVCTVAELFAALLSGGVLLVVAVLATSAPLARPAFAFTVKVNCPLPPGAREAMLQLTTPVAPTAGVTQVQPTGEVSETNVVPTGVVSFIVTVVAVEVPALVTVIV